MHLSTPLPAGISVRTAGDHIQPLTLILGSPLDRFDLNLYTFSVNGYASNAETWRKIAAAATELAQRCDDLAATAEATA